jgi:hypothetical protein
MYYKSHFLNNTRFYNDGCALFVAFGLVLSLLFSIHIHCLCFKYVTVKKRTLFSVHCAVKHT